MVTFIYMRCIYTVICMVFVGLVLADGVIFGFMDHLPSFLMIVVAWMDWKLSCFCRRSWPSPGMYIMIRLIRYGLMFLLVVLWIRWFWNMAVANNICCQQKCYVLSSWNKVFCCSPCEWRTYSAIDNVCGVCCELKVGYGWMNRSTL